MLLKEKQLSLKKKIAKKWLKTEEGKMLMAWLGANNISQDMRVQELIFKFGWKVETISIKTNSINIEKIQRKAYSSPLPYSKKKISQTYSNNVKYDGLKRIKQPKMRREERYEWTC